MLKLEAGKRYWMRYGGVSGALRLNRDATYPFTDGAFTWSAEGKRKRWDDGHEYQTDLVREYTEPQPLEWKRGIPTEEECRECWLIYGGSGEYPRDCDSDSQVVAPSNSEVSSWDEGDWYLALKVKPVEPPKPKTRTVKLWKLLHKNGAELWWPDSVLFATVYDWENTKETKTIEVPCE